MQDSPVSRRPASRLHPSRSPLSRLPASRLPLSRHESDRDDLSRSRPELFAELRQDPRARVLPLWRGMALLASRNPLSLALLPLDAVADPELMIYLGRSMSTTSAEPPGTPIVAAVLPDDDPAPLGRAESEWAGLRDVGGDLSDRDAGLLTEAVAMTHWHRSHRFSPRTGAPLFAEQGGWVLRSADDSIQIFPRTDPAVIVAVTDADDRILLGSNALWESNRYSLLAGFVEPGESLEAAVVREVFEESGIHVTDPVYLGSQPWPFPASLMLGFHAVADPEHSGDPVPDGTEILDLRWFTRDEMAGATDLVLPGRTSIARAIIEEWFGGPLEESQW